MTDNKRAAKYNTVYYMVSARTWNQNFNKETVTMQVCKKDP